MVSVNQHPPLFQALVNLIIFSQTALVTGADERGERGAHIHHYAGGGQRLHAGGRGLHSSTFGLIVSAFCGIGDALGGS
jgi:hypothetical protein